MKNEIIETDIIDIEKMIYEIDGKEVMLDTDLAKLYNVETKRVNEAVKNKYRLTYSRNDSNSNKCPKCGAEIKNSHATKCEYCRSVITNNNHDWILVKKEIISSF
mgnify:CR=1 FL=1